MTRDRWEKILFANVRDEVVQDMLNEYVLELEAENAKLQEVVSDGEETAHRILYESRALEAENAKLRKWCIDLLGMAENGDPEWLHWPEVHDALRKLGVDV